MVELGDTASPSESSRGHDSTYIVSCFVLANVLSCKKQNLEPPWLIVESRAAARATVFPSYNNPRPTEPRTQTSLN